MVLPANPEVSIIGLSAFYCNETLQYDSIDIPRLGRSKDASEDNEKRRILRARQSTAKVGSDLHHDLASRP